MKPILCLLMLSLVFPAYSHGGGTNAEGCHTNRRTRDYHCHNSGYYTPYRQNYCHAYQGSYRCGYARSSCDSLVRQLGGYCILQ